MWRMFQRLLSASLLLIFLSFSAPAFAQDDPRFALVAAFPTPTVSFQWELNDKFAIRVEGSYSYRDSSTEDISTSAMYFGLAGTTTMLEQQTTIATTTNTTSLGIAGIFTIRRSDHVRLYLAPRISFGFSNQTTSQTRISSGTLLPSGSGVVFGFPSSDSESFTTDDSSSSKGAGLSFGAVSDVFDRVALFGEFGAMFTRSDAPTFPTIIISSPTLRSDSNSMHSTISTRAIAGIMFRF